MIPSYFTVIKKCAFKGCTSLKKLYTENVDAVESAIILGDGITEIGDEAFRGVDSIKYIKLPSTLVTLGTQALRDNDVLQYIDYNNCSIEELGKFEFYDNKALITVTLPNSLTSLGADRIFNGCSKLQVLYLPSGLTSIGSVKNIGGLYFTDEPYQLEWTDGMFDSENWNGQKPQKPTVYYFPENLGNFEEAFNSCHNLNDVIVFPEGVTTITNKNTFYNLDNKTFVFLGEVTSFYQESNKKSNFYFINDSVTEETLTVTGNGKHNLFFHSAGVHACEKTEEIGATCLENAKLVKICFCGNQYETQENENTALGHNHSIFEELVYVNYLEQGDYNYMCERCGNIASKEKAPALFLCLGYSASETGVGGIAIGYMVDGEAIANYTSTTGVTLKYGVFAVMQSKLGDNDVFGDDGAATNGVINAEITNYGFTAFELKVTGFTDEYKDAKLAMGAYVLVKDGENTEYSYMQDDAKGEKIGNYYFVSYNDVINMTE